MRRGSRGRELVGEFGGGGAPGVGGFAVLVHFAEDHFSAGGLQDAGDGDVNGFADHFAGVIDDDHGAVVEVADALIELLALFEDEDDHVLAGEDDGLEGVGEVVDVEDLDVVEVGDLVEVEVVGDDFGLPFFGQLEELEVDFADGGEVVGDDLDLDGVAGLHALEHVEAAAAALALGSVGGVGDDLELAEDELGDDHGAVNESGFGDVCDATVDDDGGVEDLGAAAGGALAGEDDAESGGVEQVAFAGADEQAYVSHEQQDEDLQDGGGGAGQRRGAQDQAEERGAEDAEDAAEYGSDEAAEAEGAHAQLKDDDQAGRRGSGDAADPSGEAEGLEEVANSGQQGDKKNTNKYEIHEGPLPQALRNVRPPAQLGSMPAGAGDRQAGSCWGRW